MDIDDRKGSAEFGSKRAGTAFDVQAALSRIGTPTRIRRLGAGDFAWIGHGPRGRLSIGVERKTVHEILEAMTDTRLTGVPDGQIVRLHRRYDLVYLVVEGVVSIAPDGLLETRGGPQHRYGRGRGMYLDYEGFLTTLSTKAGCIYAPTSGFAQTVWWLASKYRWWHKAWASHKSATHVSESLIDKVFLDNPSEAEKIKRRVIAQLPGVGWERSLSVCAYFPTLHDAFSANEESWMRALGIAKGRTIATHLRKVCYGKAE